MTVSDFPHVFRHVQVAKHLRDKFGLDEIDLQILAVLMEKWAEGNPVRVTDVTIRWGKNIAAPASIHWRLNKDMVNQRYVRLVVSTEDARVKFVIPGRRLEAVQVEVAAMWGVAHQADQEPTDAHKQLTLPLEDE